MLFYFLSFQILEAAWSLVLYLILSDWFLEF